MTLLIGLKQVLQQDCSVLFPVRYIYSDWHGNAARLYGRGFGYSRVLSPALRSHIESRPRGLRFARTTAGIREWLNLNPSGIVVVSSVSRNSAILSEVLKHQTPRHVAVVHGEDRPPTASEWDFLRRTKCRLFVRSFPDSEAWRFF